MEIFWEKENWEHEDRQLVRLQSMPFQRAFPAVGWDPGLYVLRGPRQVGKSSWLKTLLSRACQEWGASLCFFASCDELRDYQDLAELLKSAKGRRFVFLDEISFVSEWWRAIKRAVDAGEAHFLFLTGSNAMDLRRGADRMPGRHGKGRELMLLPMGFDEFEDARRQAGWLGTNRLEELRAFFRIGGFPLAVAEGGREARSAPEAMEIYRRWLAGDVTRAGRQEAYLKETLGQIATTMQTPLSLQKLASRTQMGSHHTAIDYVQILEDCFALRTLYAVDPDTGALRFRKEKKFYFTDPLIYWIALEWGGQRVPANSEEAVAELVAHEALFRRYSRIGYFHSSKGEIDFYRQGEWALEIKWAPIVHNLSKSFKDLKVPRKLVWSHANFLEEWPA